jgi:hypothetical protein
MEVVERLKVLMLNCHLYRDQVFDFTLIGDQGILSCAGAKLGIVPLYQEVNVMFTCNQSVGTLF